MNGFANRFIAFLFFISLSRPGSIRLRGLLFLPGQSAVRAGFILKRMLDVSQSTEIHQNTVVVESLRCSFTVDHTHLLGYFAADVDRWVCEVPWLSQ